MHAKAVWLLIVVACEWQLIVRQVRPVGWQVQGFEDAGAHAEPSIKVEIQSVNACQGRVALNCRGI